VSFTPRNLSIPVHRIAVRLFFVAYGAAMAGQPAEARKAMERLRRLSPNLRVADAGVIKLFHRREDLVRWTDALRQAGLPE
jgi:hypothetical protein